MPITSSASSRPSAPDAEGVLPPHVSAPHLRSRPHIRVSVPRQLRWNLLRLRLSVLRPGVASLWRGYSRWIAALRPGAALVAICVTGLVGLMFAGLLIGLLKATFGADPGPPTPLPLAPLDRRAPNPTVPASLRRTVAEVRDRVLAVRAMRVTSTTPKMTIVYNGINRTMTAEDAGGQIIAVDATGVRLIFTDVCWASTGRSSPPDPRSLVLPLAQREATFTARVDDTLRFRADRLGTLGPGTGELTLRDGMPYKLAYRPRGGAEVSFSFSYPDPNSLSLESDPFAPRCRASR